MATCKEILNRKDQWINALNETIKAYEYAIENNINYDTNTRICPLCLLSIYTNYPSVTNCKNCIHYSSFSQNKHCILQRSYHGVLSTHKQMKVRIKYLNKILKRLEDASCSLKEQFDTFLALNKVYKKYYKLFLKNHDENWLNKCNPKDWIWSAFFFPDKDYGKWHKLAIKWETEVKKIQS